MWSSNVKRLRVVELFEPTLAPAPVTCDAPFEAVLPEITMAPTGLPATQLVMSVPGSGVDEPRKKKLAREKPTRAVLNRLGEKTCCSCTLATCSRKLSLMIDKGFWVGVFAVESSAVYTAKSKSLGLRFTSKRAVPKCSRICWTGLEKASAMPVLKPVVGSSSSGPFCTGQRLKSGATPLPSATFVNAPVFALGR